MTTAARQHTNWVFSDTSLLAKRQDKLYSLTDTLSFAVMERLGISRVFTFDRNFEQHGFQLVTP